MPNANDLQGQHWIIACVGGAFFGFGLGGIADAALTLVIDSYRDVSPVPLPQSTQLPVKSIH